MRASRRSSTPLAVGPHTGCHAEGIASSTTPSTFAAISQIRQPHSDGRGYFDRKVAGGKTKREAVRSLKRQIANALYRQLVLDAQ